MDLTPQRRFVTPLAGERVEDLAARALPDEPLDSAVDKIRSWNLPIFAMRKPEWRDPDSDFEPFTWEKEKAQSQPEAQKPAAASSRS